MSALSSELEARLVSAALDARQWAHAPYSRYAVGAALLVAPTPPRAEPVIVCGCNVENASYGVTLCAERTALATAVSVGYRSLQALAVATPGPELAPPCGLCLQMLSEFVNDLDILLVTPNTGPERVRFAELWPRPFRFRPETTT